MKWIVTANTNDCRIYEYHHKALKLIKEIYHPENRLKESELGFDRPGRYKSTNTLGGGGSFSHHSEVEDVQNNNFAKEIATELNERKNHKDYKELVVIMPAQIEGLFAKHINNSVKGVIKSKQQKNIMHLSERELVEFLDSKGVH